jgi:hypothetical protein
MRVERGACRLRPVLAVLFALATLPCKLAGEEGAQAPRQIMKEPTPPATASGPRGHSSPERDAGAPQGPQPVFTPSEEIGADSVVSFPVDI